MKSKNNAEKPNRGEKPMKNPSKAQSSGSQPMDNSNAEMADSSWKSLYRVGATVALIMVVVFFPIQIIAFSMAPIPTTVIDWFTLLQNNRLLGILDLDLLYVADQALLIPLFLALYYALRRANKAYMAVATILGIVGATVYFATNNAFSMLYLSDQYAAAATDAQRSLFLAAGETSIAISQGTGWYVFNVLASVALLIVSVVMLRSSIFSKATAYVGILGSIFGLAFFVPTAGIAFLFISAFALQIWFVLIARKLYQLGKVISEDEND
jgi:hypothetical protein